MNGLLEKPTGQVTAGLAAGIPAGEPLPADQQELDAFVANGLKLVHTEKISDALIKGIVKAENPIVAVADATLNVVSRLEESAKAAGRKLSLNTVAYGGNIIMGEIILSAETAGMEKMDDETKYKAFSLAVSKWIDAAVRTGKMTKEELIQMGKEAEGTPIGQKMKETAAKMGAEEGMAPAGAPTGMPGIPTGAPVGMPAPPAGMPATRRI